MRRYHIVSGILLILPIIDFAVAAPVLVQEKRQGLDVMHISEEAITMLRKRGDELNELWFDLFGDTEDHIAKPEESSAARPSSSSTPAGLTDGSTGVKQPLPSVPEELSPVSSPDIDLNELLLKYFNDPEAHIAKPEESSTARPPPSSTPSGPADGSTDVEHPLPSVLKELSPVSSPGLELNELLLKYFNDPEDHIAKPEESSATRPPPSTTPSGPADGPTDVENPLSSVPKELSPVSSPGLELNELLHKYFNEPEDHFAKPEELSTARPSSSSQPSGPADGSTDVEQPLPSVPKEVSPVSSPGINLDELLLKYFDDPEDHFAKPELSAAHPSSSSQPSGSADGRMDVTQPLPSVPEEPPPVFSPDHAAPSSGDGLNELWFELFGDTEDHFAEPEESSAARPSSSSQPSGPADGWTDVKKPLPSIPEEPSPASSPDHAPPSPDDGLNQLWLDFFGHPENHFFAEPEESSAARPSSSLRPSEPTEGSTDVEQPLPSIPEEPSPVSSSDRAPPNPGSLTGSGYDLMKGDVPPGAPGPASTMSSAGHKLMGAYALPNPGPLTESNPEMMDVPLSSPWPVSSTNYYSQSMGADSPSGKRRKMGKGLWFTSRD
jgi:hypothetical protein